MCSRVFTTAGIAVLMSVSVQGQVPGPTGGPASLVGTWEMTSLSPMGEMKSRLVFTEEDGVLAGTLQNQFLGRQKFSSISVQDEFVVLQVDLPAPTGPITVIYNGTMAGDTITGNEIWPLQEPTIGDTVLVVPAPQIPAGALPGNNTETDDPEESWFRAVRVATTVDPDEDSSE